ncbi:type II toxin-antitoxin system HicB family antitoxin [Methylobacterium nonmethylotrophicum]|uniref:Type II toxin-antitoxin system HicB family antitoxin n=1 Tax=Methylobacterium nonmethylotrophicum TaxID=1141884 RepID=A0A4Z0NJ49_9HYPH|nr:type II toxin-antitoxin system HicB family antitoxin [Methylobacterium nonmethylotrophicum]TGD96162.1 type II toxin-antitoxin system HicB family antitoxin [Methylobacterium nonmethylotrophicum]
MLAYPIELTPDDNDTLLVTCPILPVVATFGEDEASARRHAVDAIKTVLASMIADGEEIPLPPEASTDDAVVLPLLTELKVLLYGALRTAGITRAELARRLGWNRESVDRLFRLEHHSRLEQIEAAFAALGRRVAISVRDAA